MDGFRGMKASIIIVSLALALFLLAGCYTIKPQTMTSAPTANVTNESAANATAANESVMMNETAAVEEVTTNETMTETEAAAPTLPPGMTDPYPSDLPRKWAVEGDLVNFPNLKATDPDGDPLTYTFSTPLSDKGDRKS